MWFCFDIYIWWLKKNIYSIDLGKFGKIFIHILTNDVKHICQQNFKPNDQKEKELYDFAHDFNATILQTAHAWPNIEFVVSLCLPRYDFMDQIGMISGRDIINCAIKNALSHKTNITLVNNENFTIMDFGPQDFYHLNPSGFCKLLSNWRNVIGIAKNIYKNGVFWWFFRQITTFIKVCIYGLMGLKFKNKGHTNFYKCCELWFDEKIISIIQKWPKSCLHGKSITALY